MGYKTIIFEQLSESPYFTKGSVEQIASKFGLSKHTTDSYITKGIKRGELVQLRRNFFVTKSYYDKHVSNISYVFFLANRLRTPSYVSLESALQYYEMYTEAVNVVKTSITSKVTREYSNRFGVFKYSSISPRFFMDFETIKSDFEFQIAKPYKAVFDILYYRTNLFRDDFDKNILEDMRIDTENLTENDKKKLKDMVSQFTSQEILI
ncbi:MAG: hypothetical protein WCJ19_03045 [bacterium]